MPPELQALSPHTTHPLHPLQKLPFWYCTLSRHTTQPSPHSTDATLLVLHISFSRTTSLTFLILQTFSSHHTHTLSCHCRCTSSDTVNSFRTVHNLLHFLHMRPSWHCTLLLLVPQMCHTDTADFLLTPNTLSSYCRCGSSDTVHFLLTLHNFLLVLQI